MIGTCDFGAKEDADLKILYFSLVDVEGVAVNPIARFMYAGSVDCCAFSSKLCPRKREGACCFR